MEAIAVKPEGLSVVVIITTIVFCIMTIFIVSLRVWFRRWLLWTRTEPNAWGFDDLLAALGLVPFVAACCFTVSGCYYGLGMPDAKLSTAERVTAQKLVFYFQLSEAAFTILVKSSIAGFLLRLVTQRRYRFALLFVILTTIAGCVVPGVVVLVLCKPIAAQWDPSLGTCGDYSIITNLSYAVSVITVVTDWTCAIIPCILVRKLNIPPSQKLPIMTILSLGVLASLASIGRMPYLKSYNTTVDRLVGEANIMLWCIIEGALAFIAGSLPPLLIWADAASHITPPCRGRLRISQNDSQNSLLVEAKDVSAKSLPRTNLGY